MRRSFSPTQPQVASWVEKQVIVLASDVCYDNTRIRIQKVLRGLSEEELKEGSKTIQNIASNPSTEPSTNNTEEIITVNQQQVYKNRNSKIGGYARLVELLDEDVTQYFLAKFKPLFAVFVRTRPALYVVDEEEGE